MISLNFHSVASLKPLHASGKRVVGMVPRSYVHHNKGVQQVPNTHPLKALQQNRSISLKAASNALPLPTSEDTAMPVSDTWLGQMFLKILPGYYQYILSYIMPITVVIGVLGTLYAPQALLFISSLPIIRDVHPIASVLTTLATKQPWAGLVQLIISVLTPLYAFLVMPLLDWVLGHDFQNPSPEEASNLAHDGLYRAILYAYVPVSYAVIGIVCHLLCTSPQVSPLAFIGVTLSCGVANGILFTVAHELLHGSKKLDRALAGLLLANVAYIHWSKSHLMHHIKVSTPEDPSSARRGEWLYTFIPRSIYGNLVDAFGSEAQRRSKKNIPFWSLQNRALWWVAGPLSLASLVTLVYGWKGLAFWASQAIVGILMLETVNYIEHYGLVREQRPNGRYERVAPRHSWNSSTIYTNSVTFRLQRHSDHHAHDSRPYQTLETVMEAPQLPTGYPAMMLLSLVPPLYFKVMDPIVDEAQMSAPSGAKRGPGEKSR